jgi:hypothetical protein
MNKTEFSAIEKEMANFNFDDLHAHTVTAKANIATAASAADVKSQICNIWSKIGKYVKLAENIPVVGKFIKILADLLDTLCA